MGCDIHSLAEVRDPETGNWVKVGDMFPNPWSFTRRSYTAELIEQIPADARDGYLLDAVEYQIRNRDGFGKDESSRAYYARYFPEIAPGTTLAQKAIRFGQNFSAAIEWGRSDEGRKAIDENFSTYPDCHDPDGWARFIHAQKIGQGKEANLSEDERATLVAAILSHNTLAISADDDDGEDDTRLWTLELNFHRLHGPGWFARYREGDTPNTDKDAPEHLDDGLPFWLNEFSYHDAPLDSRNYTLFAALADVRNDSRSGQRIEPISEPKGVPDDASPEYLTLVAGWGVDGHSHTYLTLSELKNYDVDGDVRYTGLVSETQYEKLLAEGYPDDPYVGPSSWAGGIGGAGVVTFTEAGYKKWVEIGRPYIRQPQSVSFLAPDIHVSPELLPDEPVSPGVAALQAAPAFHDRQNTTTMEQATAGKVDETPGVPESALDDTFQRYSYNGVRPYIEVTWKQKRGKMLGREFRDMIEIFDRIVAERELTDDDIRVCCLFDN